MNTQEDVFLNRLNDYKEKVSKKEAWIEDQYNKRIKRNRFFAFIGTVLLFPSVLVFLITALSFMSHDPFFNPEEPKSFPLAEESFIFMALSLMGILFGAFLRGLPGTLRESLRLEYTLNVLVDQIKESKNKKHK